MNKKIAAFLAIALLISLSGCGGNSAGNDVPPSSSIESQSQPEAPETTPETTASTSQTQDPPQSEEPIEATQTPAERDLTGSAEPTTDPTKQPEETAPTSTSAPATSTPAHTHNYTSTITKQATCDANGIITYACSCGDSYTENIQATGHTYDGGKVVKEATCAEAGGKMFTCTKCGAMYTEAIPTNGNHSWATRHVDEVGHMASNGTYQLFITQCNCGFIVSSDDPDANYKWNYHKSSLGDNCRCRSMQWYETCPNDPTWVVDIPAHDETYCTICGAIQ